MSFKLLLPHLAKVRAYSNGKNAVLFANFVEVHYLRLLCNFLEGHHLNAEYQ